MYRHPPFHNDTLPSATSAYISYTHFSITCWCCSTELKSRNLGVLLNVAALLDVHDWVSVAGIKQVDAAAFHSVHVLLHVTSRNHELQDLGGCTFVMTVKKPTS